MHKTIMIIFASLCLNVGCAQKNHISIPDINDFAGIQFGYNDAAGQNSTILKSYGIPSTSVSYGKSGKPIRFASLIEVNWDSTYLKYQVFYRNNNMKSIAKYQLASISHIIDEVFEKQFRVEFTYSKECPACYGIPGGYLIYAYDSTKNDYSKKIDSLFFLKKEQGGHWYYKSNSSGIVEVNIGYFNLVPENRGNF